MRLFKWFGLLITAFLYLNSCELMPESDAKYDDFTQDRGYGQFYTAGKNIILVWRFTRQEEDIYRDGQYVIDDQIAYNQPIVYSVVRKLPDQSEVLLANGIKALSFTDSTAQAVPGTVYTIYRRHQSMNVGLGAEFAQISTERLGSFSLYITAQENGPRLNVFLNDNFASLVRISMRNKRTGLIDSVVTFSSQNPSYGIDDFSFDPKRTVNSDLVTFEVATLSNWLGQEVPLQSGEKEILESHFFNVQTEPVSISNIKETRVVVNWEDRSQIEEGYRVQLFPTTPEGVLFNVPAIDTLLPANSTTFTGFMLAHNVKGFVHAFAGKMSVALPESPRLLSNIPAPQISLNSSLTNETEITLNVQFNEGFFGPDLISEISGFKILTLNPYAEVSLSRTSTFLNQVTFPAPTTSASSMSIGSLTSKRRNFALKKSVALSVLKATSYSNPRKLSSISADGSYVVVIDSVTTTTNPFYTLVNGSSLSSLAVFPVRNPVAFKPFFVEETPLTVLPENINGKPGFQVRDASDTWSRSLAELAFLDLAATDMVQSGTARLIPFTIWFTSAHGKVLEFKNNVMTERSDLNSGLGIRDVRYDPLTKKLWYIQDKSGSSDLVSIVPETGAKTVVHSPNSPIVDYRLNQFGPHALILTDAKILISSDRRSAAFVAVGNLTYPALAIEKPFSSDNNVAMVLSNRQIRFISLDALSMSEPFSINPDMQIGGFTRFGDFVQVSATAKTIEKVSRTPRISWTLL